MSPVGANMSTEDLLEKAKSLPAAQQLELVEGLLDVLDQPDTAVDAAWAKEAKDRLRAYRSGQVRAIPLEDVLYLQADEKYVVVHHTHGEDLIEEPLRKLEEEFSAQFVRIHRNCLVARRRLRELRRTPAGQVQAVLRDVPQPLEVSRRCVAALKAELAGA